MIIPCHRVVRRENQRPAHAPVGAAAALAPGL